VYAAGLLKATVVEASGEPTSVVPPASTGAMAKVTWSVAPRNREHHIGQRTARSRRERAA
jgi:hypothetical protein